MRHRKLYIAEVRLRNGSQTLS